MEPMFVIFFDNTYMFNYDPDDKWMSKFMRLVKCFPK